ncbi:MAG: hypothetical protein L0956_03930, partial [Candidatus Mariimomonas ferrooxydans]
MFNEDTIAAISTSIGHSSIGIVRLSGINSIRITDKIFISPKKKSLKKASSHSLHTTSTITH